MSNQFSQLNKSISKQLYSFSKAERFQKTLNSPQFFAQKRCKESFYNYRLNTITNRSTSLGYGKKIDLVNKQDVPPPGKYEKHGSFVLDKIKKRGYSFSRNSKRSIINEEEVVNKPGPGKYQTDKDIKFAHLKYSFRSKFQLMSEKVEHDLGPGQYKTLQVINKEGHHFLARFQDSKSRRFPRSSRFQLQRVKTPGPGAYQDDKKLAMNKTGSYFNSRFKNNVSSVFGRSNRPSLAGRSISPGPGKYQKFSEFNSNFR